jgi:hypothetical protein
MSSEPQHAAPAAPAATHQPLPTPMAPQHPQVPIWLWLGIAFVPYIFAWFTLRRGYLPWHRAVALGWLALVLIAQTADPPGKRKSAIEQQIVFDAIPRSLSMVDGDPNTATWESGMVFHFLKNGLFTASTTKNGQTAVMSGKWWREGEHFAFQFSGGMLNGQLSPVKWPPVRWVAIRRVNQRPDGLTVYSVKATQGSEAVILAE